MKLEIKKKEIVYDVLVAGGGPAGCAAAAAAARAGAKTLLLESSGMLGGMATRGLVPSWCPFSDGKRILYRGLGLRVFEALRSRMKHVAPDALNWVPIHAETLKKVYDELMEEFGVTVLFFTQVCGVSGENGQIHSVFAANKEGLCEYQARIYVDATGDGDLAGYAGGEFQPAPQEKQPASLCFALSGVNEKEYRKAPTLHMHNKDSIIYEILRDGRYPLIQDAHICQTVIAPGTIGFNAGHIWKVEPDNLSEAMILGRKIAWQYKEALAEYLPHIYGNAVLAETASLIGIRESRNILGEYTFTVEDYFERKEFEDGIGRNCYYIDVHFTSRESGRSRSGELKHEGLSGREEFKEVHKKEYKNYGPGESHAIPYRMLIPKGIENLLVAGKAISCDHLVQASIRAMPACLVTGEAAGEAAAMAAAGDGRTRNVDIQTLRERIVGNGGYLG